MAIIAIHSGGQVPNPAFGRSAMTFGTTLGLRWIWKRSYVKRGRLKGTIPSIKHFASMTYCLPTQPITHTISLYKI